MISHNTADNINDSDAFTKHLGMFTHPKGAHLTQRTQVLGDWLQQRIDAGTWNYSRFLEKSPTPVTGVKNTHGAVVEKINFGSQDYLGLASHPSVHNAAVRAERIRSAQRLVRYFAGQHGHLAQARTINRRFDADGKRAAVSDRMGGGIRNYRRTGSTQRPHRA